MSWEPTLISQEPPASPWRPKDIKSPARAHTWDGEGPVEAGFLWAKPVGHKQQVLGEGPRQQPLPTGTQGVQGAVLQLGVSGKLGTMR